MGEFIDEHICLRVSTLTIRETAPEELVGWHY